MTDKKAAAQKNTAKRPAAEKVTVDGNTAVGRVAHSLSEVISIYPITPSSPMGEVADDLSAKNEKNIWGTVPAVIEMQSEAGASGAVHGALTSGALSSTFTASQGLLLMIPNLYKIAGELTSTVFHIAARAVATNALSIFGDHSDVMACRQTGWAMIASNSVQEAQDMAVIAHAATLRTRIPFMHFFDGFRTSHEIQKFDEISFADMRQMIDDDLVHAHRARGLNPERPEIRGTAQNPDVYFQGREAVNKYYLTVPQAVQQEMDKFAKITGRKYKLFEYVGDPNATKVMVIMGSGADAAHETVEYLVKQQKKKVGLVKVHLYRPFAADRLLKAIPETAKKIVVMDRTKEPGSIGEPLYEDVATAFNEAGRKALITGGRYGIGSKDFTPAMIIACFDNLDAKDKTITHFTVGITDDVTKKSLKYDESFFIAEKGMTEAMFYGLGSDGTVGANKIAIKIIGDARPDLSAQAYFSYDSKKSGGITISHLRFGKGRIRRPYLVTSADFLACHKFAYMDAYNMLKNLKEGGVFLLNSRFDKDHVWDELPAEQQKQILAKKAQFYVIDAFKIAEKAGMGNRINIVMLAAFFKISTVLKEAEAVKYMKKFIEKTYGKKGQEVVNKNISTIELALAAVERVELAGRKATSSRHMVPSIKNTEDPFIKNVLGALAAQEGDKVPVSKIPADGTYPTATTQYEKRGVGETVASWIAEKCIYCGLCSLQCPHACIRMKPLTDAEAAAAPKGFKCADGKPKVEGQKMVLGISAEDCTGCSICVDACPVPGKALEMVSFTPEYRDQEIQTWNYFLNLPEPNQAQLNMSSPKDLSLKRPLFEFSGACAGCGETPYIKMISQMFGDRAMIANATGCSSIYGGNLPTTPYATTAAGTGPVWSNSLFEDAAEFGLGMRLTVDKLTEYAHEVAEKVKAKGLAVKEIDALLTNDQADEAAIDRQRANVAALKKALSGSKDALAKELVSVADNFIKKSNWIIGGDGWAYDIGFGGLDHVLASGRNVNVLCLDTEVYSNTGGQMSKATPIGAIAKFAAGGKDIGKKDLGMIAMSYGYVYVAQVSLGANHSQTIKAVREAESYDGPSLIIAYSHCISHTINMAQGLQMQKKAVNSGLWPLYRYDPRRVAEGKNPFQLDSKEPSFELADYMYSQGRFKALKTANPDRANMLLDRAALAAKRRWQEYKYLADRPF
ncbi:MAG: pyruvate:ferredoxin (flavodoxin) oxidoreductase [Treponema sp.]|nr:pyruvate:ferredoxin (flavodoxin) oxidoreductase [Treponema sp.]